MTAKPNDSFLVLLLYADAAGHKLSAQHAATASGLALRTTFAKIAKAKEILAARSQESNPAKVSDDAFEILLRYAEAAKHNLSAKHAATATGLALRTTFAKIAKAKKASERASNEPEAPVEPKTETSVGPKKSGGRKRKVLAGEEASAIGDNSAQVKKTRKAKKGIKEEIREITPKMEIKVEQVVEA